MEFEGAHEEIVWRSNEVIGRWVGDRRASLKTYRCAKSDASSPFTTWVRVTGWQDDSTRVGVRTGVIGMRRLVLTHRVSDGVRDVWNELLRRYCVAIG